MDKQAPETVLTNDEQETLRPGTSTKPRVLIAAERRRFGRHLLLVLPLVGAALIAQQARPAEAGGSSDNWK